MSLRAPGPLIRALLAIACWLTLGTAWGKPLSATIRVDRSPGADDCPDSAALTGNVERILQRTLRLGSNADPALEVEVHFAADHDEYSANVQSLGAKPGERKLRDHGRSCAALAQAVSVAIALLLDKELARPDLAPPPLPAPAAPAQPLTSPPLGEPAVALPAASSVDWRVTLEGGLALGLLGSSSALLTEQLGVRVRQHWILDAGFNAVFSTTTSYGVGAVQTSLLFGNLRACYTWGERFSLGPCAALGIGRLRGEGIGYSSAQSSSLLWTALGAGVVAEGPLWGRVFWGASGNAWLPTRRSTFSVDHAGTAWETRPVGASLSARLGFRFW